MDTAQFQPIINFIWGVADDLLRDVYARSGENFKCCFIQAVFEERHSKIGVGVGR